MKLLPLLLFALLSTACMGREATIAWNGVQEARVEQGASLLRWNTVMAPYVERRAEELAVEDPGADVGHEGAMAVISEYQKVDGDGLCEIACWWPQGQPDYTFLWAMQHSEKHWGCAMNAEYTSAAVAIAEGPSGFYAVMWLQ